MKHEFIENDNVIRLKTLSEIKTFTDPYRMLIYKTFSNSEKPITIKHVADKMGEVPAKVYYHAKKLIKLGVLELDHEKNINGIIAKYYVATKRRIVLSHESLDESQMPSMLSETENMISNVIDDAKSEFISAMQKKAQTGLGQEEDNGCLMVSRIHLTEKEADDLHNYLHALLENKKDAQSDKTSKYLFFSGLIDIAPE